MTPRLEPIVARISEVLRDWSAVDCTTVIQSGDDPLDPYFFLSFDVYSTAPLPQREERQASFPDAVAFEAAPVSRKDRFLINELPVRIEYKEVARFDQLVSAAMTGVPIFRVDGTYAFYRLASAAPCFERTEWLAQTRAALAELPESFWSGLARGMAARLEHIYADLSAAVARSDRLFFLSSAAAFAGGLCSLLFVMNRRFEPSPRQLGAEVGKLPTLPTGFAARFETYLDDSGKTDPARKRELAEMLIRGVLSLLEV